MPSARAGTLVAGRFVLERHIASGGMGDVYRAVDQQSGERVAVKLLRAGEPRVADRLAAEARALVELNHPAIVRYVAHGTAPGLHFVAMEWVEGVTLSDRIHAGRLGCEEALVLAARAADGLAAVHARGMIHRDIKPLNLILPDGRIDHTKIIDFGIVRAHAAQALTTAGIAIGTPEYMAPEQLRCEEHIGPTADIFALGCVLYRALTGVAAFQGEHLEAVMAKIAMVHEPPRVTRVRADVPKPLDDLIARMLAHDPRARPKDGRAAVELVREVRAALAIDTGAIEEFRPQPSITTREQLPAVVILVERPGTSAAVEPPDTIPAFDPIAMDSTIRAAGDATDPRRPTIAVEALQVLRMPSDARRVLEDLRRVLEPNGVLPELLPNGSLVALLSEAAAATDLAERAARCALAIRAVLPDASIAVVTGRTVLDDREALERLFDTAAALLHAKEPAIYLDPVTRDLLSSRFEVAGGGEDAFRLVEERARGGVGTEPPRLVLGRSTPCVGRAGVLRQLQGLFDECMEGPSGQAVVLVAEAGMGKSRLRAELVSRIAAERPDALIVAAWGDALRSKVPHGVVGRALRELFAIPESPLEARRVALAAAVQRLFAAPDAERVGAFLGEIIGVRSPDSAGPALAAARQDPALMAEQKRNAFADWLAAECDRRPVLLVVDDLHWADVASVELIAAALKKTRERALLVCAFARPEVRDEFPKLDEAWSRQEIVLRPLAANACFELVRGVLGDGVDEAMVKNLVERSVGNPFYLEELVRAAAAGREGVLPESVLASLQLRLSRLPESARQVLRAGSVFGAVFWPEGVARLLGGEDDRGVGDGLAVLEREELVQRQRDRGAVGQRPYAFRHDLVREAAYRMLTEDDRQVGHRLAGDWLVENGESDAIVLAEHFAEGGELHKAAGYYARAGETCTATYANQAAVGFYERAIALWSTLDPAEAARTLLKLAAMRERLGQRKEALEDLASAEANADVPTRIELLIQRARLEIRGQEQGVLERARRTAEQARDLAGSIGAKAHEANALVLIAVAYAREESEDSSRKAVQLAEMAVHLMRGQGELGPLLWQLGNAFLFRNDLERAANLYGEALAAARANGDELLTARCLNNMSMGAFRRWALDEAIDGTRQAREIGRRVGHRVLTTEATINLGTFLHARGDFAEARPLFEEALANAQDDWVLTTSSLEMLADLERHLGHERRAQDLLEQAVRLCERVGVGQRQALYMGFLAESYWFSGAIPEALDRLADGAELAGFTLSHALLLVDLGGYDEAMSWLGRFAESEPDAHRRVAALMALTRVHWQQRRLDDAKRTCDRALEILEKSPADRFWLPAAVLTHALRGEVDSALAALERARDRTSPYLFAEAAIDVGRALAIGGAAESAMRLFLSLTEGVQHGGIGYHLVDLRSRLLARCGLLHEAQETWQRAKTTAAELIAALPEDSATRVHQHPWIQELERPRVI
jgi:eukaryotic-like serine/threonine-protein kinase